MTDIIKILLTAQSVIIVGLIMISMWRERNFKKIINKHEAISKLDDEIIGNHIERIDNQREIIRNNKLIMDNVLKIHKEELKIAGLSNKGNIDLTTKTN